MPNDDESYYIPDNDFLFECSLKQDEFVFFMFQDEMYLEEGDRVFSDIQITLKKKKTNTRTKICQNQNEAQISSQILLGKVLY